MPVMMSDSVHDAITRVQNLALSLDSESKRKVLQWVNDAIAALRKANSLALFDARKEERLRILGRALELEAILRDTDTTKKKQKIHDFLSRTGSITPVPAGVSRLSSVLDISSVSSFLAPQLKGNPIDIAVIINSDYETAIKEVCKILLMNGYYFTVFPDKDERFPDRTGLHIVAKRYSENPQGQELADLLRTIRGYYTGTFSGNGITVDTQKNQFGIIIPPKTNDTSSQVFVFSGQSAKDNLQRILEIVKADLEGKPRPLSLAQQRTGGGQPTSPTAESTNQPGQPSVQSTGSAPSPSPASQSGLQSQIPSRYVRYNGSIRFNPREHSLGREFKFGQEDHRVEESARFLGYDPEWDAAHPSQGVFDLSQIRGGIVLDGSAFEFSGLSRSMEDLSKSLQSWLGNDRSGWIEVVQRGKLMIYALLKEKHAYGTRIHVLAFDSAALKSEAEKLGKSLDQYMSMLLTRQTPLPSSLIPAEGLGHVALDIGNRGRSYLLANKESHADMLILETLTDSSQSWKLNPVPASRGT